MKPGPVNPFHKDGQPKCIKQFPHCDIRVLHYPGECKYCDACPEWQELRYYWGIAFTGKKPEDGEMSCPSDFARGLGKAHEWYGNTPTEGTK